MVCLQRRGIIARSGRACRLRYCVGVDTHQLCASPHSSRTCRSRPIEARDREALPQITVRSQGRNRFCGRFQLLVGTRDTLHRVSSRVFESSTSGSGDQTTSPSLSQSPLFSERSQQGGSSASDDVSAVSATTSRDAFNASRRGLLLGAATSSMSGVLGFPGQHQADAIPAQTFKQAALDASGSGSGWALSGLAALRNPDVNRGLATERAVRSALGLDGLLPVRRTGLQPEVDRALLAIRRCSSGLDKYQAVMLLRETKTDVFYGVLEQNLIELLPIIYTPVVGEACQQWSELLQQPTALYISAEDQGSVEKLLRNWPSEDVKIAVVTDGERILGLGDLGINGAGIPVGKCAVYTAAAGIHARHLLPIALDTGCNTRRVVQDPLYLGLLQERLRGERYDALVDELVAALQARYGPSLLVHWEDFSARNSFRLLQRYREQGVPTFNDDIESTAGAVVAAVLGALRLPGVARLRDQVFLFFGAGQANIGSARLLTRALLDQGLSAEQARERMWFYDSKGVVYQGRKEGRMTPEKAEFERPAADGARVAQVSGLVGAVQAIHPTALVGAAAVRGSFDAAVIRALVQSAVERGGSGARPIVLALSNPADVAECTAREAYDWSGGWAVYASGTAFAPFQTRDGSRYIPAQANNSLIFPGVGLGCMASGAVQVSDNMMLAAARAVAMKLTDTELSLGLILPEVDRIREVALGVAAAVALTAKQEMVASSTGMAVLPCLSSTSASLDSKSLEAAERCIAKLQYDPFASKTA